MQPKLVQKWSVRRQVETSHTRAHNLLPKCAAAQPSIQEMGTSTPTNSRRRKRGVPSVRQVATVSIISAASWASAFQATPGWSTARGTGGLHHQCNRPSSVRVVDPRIIAGVAAPSFRHLSSPTASVADASELESLTVKELRQLIKENGLETKGLSGKRKAELITYVVESANGGTGISFSQDAPSSGELEAESAVISPRIDVEPEAPRKRKGARMPAMPLSDVNGAPQKQLDEKAEPKKASAKHKIYREVMGTYPPLSEYINPNTLEYYDPLANNKPEGLGDEDIRHKHHPMLKGMRTSDLDVVFVGTASCTPGITRGVSCTALRLQWRRKKGQIEGNKKNDKKGQKGGKGKNVRDMLSPDGRYDESGNGDFNGSDAAGRTWLFDCGESTQLQIQRTGSIKPGKISKIFVTHAHGDHSFGLPGLLCLMGTNRDRDSPPIDIYGPEGLRAWLRVAIRYSVSRIVPPYRVHELLDIPMAPEWEEARRNPGRFFLQLEKAGGKAGEWVGRGLAGDDPESWISRAPMINLKPSSNFGEIPGGRDIFPIYDHPLAANGAPVWEVEDEGDVRVFAAPMSHGVPCVGYVVEEESKPGRLRPELVQPIIKKNYAALREAGMKAPMKVMAVIKDLPPGESFTFPDGTVVQQSDVVEPPRRGRKVCICGDTADARAMEGIAAGSDLVIHEATNSFLSGIDRDTNKHVVTKDAMIHGHSTPEMAGNFAKKVGAKQLVLNHFSPRYKGDQSLESISIMTRIERQAMKASSLPLESVAAAWDLMILPIPQTDSEEE